jgi:hypothetical protein
MFKRSKEWKALDNMYLHFFSWTMLGLALGPVFLTVLGLGLNLRMDPTGRVVMISIYLAILGLGAALLRWRVRSFKCPRYGSGFDRNLWKFRRSCSQCGHKIYDEC